MDKETQDRIIAQINLGTQHLRGTALKTARGFMLTGAVIALGEQAPPFWTISIMCGRVDRVFGAGAKKGGE